MNINTVNLASINERVLVVDDDLEILGLLQLQLYKLGLKADVSQNGRSAIKKLAIREYGLVISDIEMPEMDGMSLLRHIQYAHPTTDVLISSGHDDRYSFSDIIDAGAADFIAKPLLPDELKAKLQRIFRERQLISDLAQIKEREKSFFLHIVESLAVTLDEKDQYTHGHSRRVTNLSLQLADQIAAEETVDYDLLRLSGILHDIGKIGVPDTILTSTGKLSDQEFEIIKRHPAQAVHILQPLEAADRRISQISKIIRHHHERYDGAGYPDGLKSHDIPLLSRIIAIADSYDAMTSDRSYRKGMATEVALKEISNKAGSQFDPSLAEKFITLMEKVRSGKSCSRLEQCDIFHKLATNEVSQAYRMQYCCADFRSCARFKTAHNESHLSTLLPDGSYLMENQALDPEVDGRLHLSC